MIKKFLADDPTVKRIWDGKYDVVTNNCQTFVIQMLKLLASGSPPQYYNILLTEQGKVISKLWSVENNTSWPQILVTFLFRFYRSRDPPLYVTYSSRKLE
jgi:hypothetical protein